MPPFDPCRRAREATPRHFPASHAPSLGLLRLPLDLLLDGFADPGRKLHLALAGGSHRLALEVAEIDDDPTLAGEPLPVGFLALSFLCSFSDRPTNRVFPNFRLLQLVDRALGGNLPRAAQDHDDALVEDRLQLTDGSRRPARRG